MAHQPDICDIRFHLPMFFVCSPVLPSQYRHRLARRMPACRRVVTAPSPHSPSLCAAQISHIAVYRALSSHFFTAVRCAASEHSQYWCCQPKLLCPCETIPLISVPAPCGVPFIMHVPHEAAPRRAALLFSSNATPHFHLSRPELRSGRCVTLRLPPDYSSSI